MMIYNGGSSSVKSLNLPLLSCIFGLDSATLVNQHELKTSGEYVNRQSIGRAMSLCMIKLSVCT